MREFLNALVEARAGRAPVPDFPRSEKPSSLEQGYAVQEELHDLLGEKGFGEVVGHKIGCTTPVMQAYLGVPHPCAGGVFASTVYPRTAELGLGEFVAVGIECEIGVTIGSGMLGADPFTRDDVGQYVEACWASIEIVDNRYANFESLGTAALIADDFFNAGLVMGDPVRDWESVALGEIEGRVLVDGVEAARGRGDAILGHPFEALAWLATMKAQAGTPLEKGQLVTLGSVVKTIWIERRDTHVEIEFEGLGGCSVRFEA